MPADVSASLPQLDLAEGTVVTVTFDDANAVITSLNVHGWQDNPDVGEPAAPDGTLILLPAAEAPA